MTSSAQGRPDVGVVVDPTLVYGHVPPYHPAAAFPEYPFPPDCVDPTNTAYGAVRDALRSLALDAEHEATPAWNPLRGIVQPGDRVVIKPNAVCERNMDPSQSVFASITHPSVLRPIVDYCWLALSGRGEIVIADAPLMSADFDMWRALTGMDALQALYRDRLGFEVIVRDLRETTTRWHLGFTPSRFRRTEPRDPLGYTDVDLGSLSLLSEFGDRDIERVYGADYRVAETIRSHSGGRHQYRVANTILAADVLVSVPKLKLHKKVGVTLNIKGMVGIIGDKNTIVHYRRGSPAEGGDEYPERVGWLQDLSNRVRMWLLTKIAAKHRRSWDFVYLLLETVRRLTEFVLVRDSRANRKLLGGSWHGNDTAWRMGCDLLRVALYGRPGLPRVGSTPRRFFSVVDGIIGGDLDGPLSPRARPVGAVLAGFNPVAVDWVGARLMNVDPSKLRLLTSARGATDLAWSGEGQPVIHSWNETVRGLWHNAFHLEFEAPEGWRCR